MLATSRILENLDQHFFKWVAVILSTFRNAVTLWRMQIKSFKKFVKLIHYTGSARIIEHYTKLCKSTRLYRNKMFVLSYNRNAKVNAS